MNPGCLVFRFKARDGLLLIDSAGACAGGRKERRATAVASHATLRGSWLVDSGFVVEVLLAGVCLRGTGAHVARARACAESSLNLGGVLICFPTFRCPNMSAGRMPNSACACC